MENMQQPNIDLPDQGSNVSQQISQENGTDQSFSQTHNSSVEVIVQHPRAEVKPPIKQLVPLINNEAEHLVKKGSNEQQDQIVTSIISQFCSVLKTNSVQGAANRGADSHKLQYHHPWDAGDFSSHRYHEEDNCLASLYPEGTDR
jgi:hypothetical protein